MYENSDLILQAVLELPQAERLSLVGRILELTAPDDKLMSLDDAGLEAELDMRFTDQDGAVAWTELDAEGTSTPCPQGDGRYFR